MNTSVKMLKYVLMGLPESSIVKLSIDGKLYDLEVAGITRMNPLPDPRQFHEIREYVILADNGNFEVLTKDIPIKKVFKARKNREGEPND